MSAFTDPSSVPIHSPMIGTSCWTTGTTRTSTGGGGGAGLRAHAVPSRSAAATSVRRDFTPLRVFRTETPSRRRPMHEYRMGRSLLRHRDEVSITTSRLFWLPRSWYESGRHLYPGAVRKLYTVIGLLAARRRRPDWPVVSTTRKRALLLIMRA